MTISLKKLSFLKIGIFGLSLIIISIILGTGSYFLTIQNKQYQAQLAEINLQTASVVDQRDYFEIQLASNSAQLASISAQLLYLQNQDQKLRNDKLQQEIVEIEKTYNQAVTVYEKLVKLRELTTKTADYDSAFTKALTLLAIRNYASASAQLAELDTKIKKEQANISSTFTIPPNINSSNNPPGSGFSSQKVTTDIGEYLVSMVAGDLASTKVVVDTASDGDCRDNCSVLALSDYVSRNGAFAGINGSYFCPASYPSCVGKTNSFDTLLMNKNKVYFNSDNNIYSVVPAVIFGGSWVRFVGKSQEWGRDTGIDSMIANQPMTVAGSNVVFGGDGDPKKGSKGTRSFVAHRGNTVYIGVVYNVTVAEAAYVHKALGFEDALNLDSGGSTALWFGGYKVGPGRAIPNAILFVRR